MRLLREVIAGLKTACLFYPIPCEMQLKDETAREPNRSFVMAKIAQSFFELPSASCLFGGLWQLSSPL